MWKTKIFNTKEEAHKFIRDNHNKKNFSYEYKYDGEFFTVTYIYYEDFRQ